MFLLLLMMMVMMMVKEVGKVKRKFSFVFSIVVGGGCGVVVYDMEMRGRIKENEKIRTDITEEEESSELLLLLLSFRIPGSSFLILISTQGCKYLITTLFFFFKTLDCEEEGEEED